jgi:hypothetical protein
MEADKWVIAVMFPTKMRLEIYSVNDNRLKYSKYQRPCGQNLVLRVEEGGSLPIATIDNVQIKNLGYLRD